MKGTLRALASGFCVGLEFRQTLFVLDFAFLHRFDRVVIASAHRLGRAGLTPLLVLGERVVKAFDGALLFDDAALQRVTFFLPLRLVRAGRRILCVTCRRQREQNQRRGESNANPDRPGAKSAHAIAAAKRLRGIGAGGNT